MVAMVHNGDINYSSTLNSNYAFFNLSSLQLNLINYNDVTYKVNNMIKTKPELETEPF